MTLAIHELTPEYETLGDVDLDAPEDASTLEALLQSNRDTQSAKLLSVAKVVLGLEDEAGVLEQQVSRVSGKIRARRHRIEFLKRWILLEMRAADLQKVKDPFVTIWIQMSPPSVQVLNELAVPAKYQHAVLRLPYSAVPAELKGYLQQLDIDKGAILAEAKQTGEVPNGIFILTGEKHLRIR